MAAVRRGQAQRQVARRYKVSLRAVQYWSARAAGQALSQVDWEDRSHAPHRSPRRTSASIVRRILQARQQLRHGVLGFVGAEAIAEALAKSLAGRLPSVRTIGRILARHGALDGRKRQRRNPPPPGWYLPKVAGARAELDAFDFIEDLCLDGGRWVDVLTTRALWGPVCGAWPVAGAITTDAVLTALPQHWRRHGLPAYAQFDNDRRFHGPHRHPDTLGRVVRLCLQLKITPVFAPPREHGLQNLVESFNDLWQEKVWQRFEFPHRAALAACSDRFVAALITRRAVRTERAPQRRGFPSRWQFNPRAALRGKIIFVRRADEQGQVNLLGHTWTVDPLWPHRLVRAELNFDQNTLSFFRLRRSAPLDQPLIKKVPYRFPHRT